MDEWINGDRRCIVNSIFYIFILFLPGGWLFYNNMIVSAIHQHESAMGIHMSSLS